MQITRRLLFAPGDVDDLAPVLRIVGQVQLVLLSERAGGRKEDVQSFLSDAMGSSWEGDALGDEAPAQEVLPARLDKRADSLLGRRKREDGVCTLT